MIFPLVIHKEKRTEYGVIVPDLPGCFSSGKTIEQAIDMAREAIELHLEGLIAEGMPIPLAKPIERHRRNKEFASAVWAVVEVAQPKTGKTNRRARAAA